MPVETSVNAGPLLDDLLSSPHDPVLVLDASGGLVAFNLGAGAMFDLTDSQGQPLAAIPSLAAVFDLLIQPADHPALWDGPEQRTFLVQHSPTPSGGSLVMLRDVSDWKQLGLKLADLMHIVSHDLRTPLTAIKSYADMLVESYFGEMSIAQQTALEKLTLSIYGMVNLVDNLQAADRFDPRKGLYKTERQPIDVDQTAQSVLKDLQLPAEIQNITLELDADPNLPILRADQLMLEQALTNLVENALKYSPEGTTVVVRITPDGDAILFAVSDQGRGIAPEDQARIFDRGVRIEQAGQKRVRGSGLGLFVVQSVAQRHGGRVWVESVLDQGSTFFLRIPVRGEPQNG